MKRFQAAALAVLFSLAFTPQALAAEGNAARGQRVFGACAACHSLEPDRNMTGPSLAELWNRKAGTLSSFTRYSAALQSASIVWDDKTLNAWIEDPQHVVRGNSMTFPGIKDGQQRADLLAFLKGATQPGRSPSQPGQQNAQMSGMAGMMGGGRVPNLKKPGPERRIQRITYCKDTYRVTTADGTTRPFWERNLRFKTDSGSDGPEKSAPALVAAGMMGDRADVIFADPGEISQFIAGQC